MKYLPVLLGEARIGDAKDADEAWSVLLIYAEERYRYLYYDGRSHTAVRVACLDRLAEELGRTPKERWPFERQGVPAYGDEGTDAWVLV